MIKQILLFISLISVSLSNYRPMWRRTIDFGVNIFYSKEIDSCSELNSFIKYVRTCQEGKHCFDPNGSLEYSLRICKEIPKYRKTIGETCTTDFECDGRFNYGNELKCSTDKKCELEDDNKYTVKDSVSGLNIFYCNSEKIPFYGAVVPYFSDPSSAPTVSCGIVETNNVKADYNKFHVTKNSANNYIGLEAYKVPGKITFKTRVEGGDYEIESIDFEDIRSLSVGNPVYDKRACERGFALYFYEDGSLVKPNGATKMYLFCANFKEILNGKILYSLA